MSIHRTIYQNINSSLKLSILSAFICINKREGQSTKWTKYKQRNITLFTRGIQFVICRRYMKLQTARIVKNVGQVSKIGSSKDASHSNRLPLLWPSGQAHWLEVESSGFPSPPLNRHCFQTSLLHICQCTVYSIQLNYTNSYKIPKNQSRIICTSNIYKHLHKSII